MCPKSLWQAEGATGRLWWIPRACSAECRPGLPSAHRPSFCDLLRILPPQKFLAAWSCRRHISSPLTIIYPPAITACTIPFLPFVLTSLSALYHHLQRPQSSSRNHVGFALLQSCKSCPVRILLSRAFCRIPLRSRWLTCSPTTTASQGNHYSFQMGRPHAETAGLQLRPL